MADAVIDLIGRHGYWAVACLMLVENLFPPFPSELIMPFAGFQAARGELHWLLVILSGVLGSLAGALPWYMAGRVLGLHRMLAFADAHGRWLTISRGELEQAQRWFTQRGPATLVLGRVVPGVRTLVSLPAGICRMAPARFCLWTVAGSLLWCSALTAAGYLLEANYEKLAHGIRQASTGVVVAIVAWYLWRVVRFRK